MNDNDYFGVNNFNSAYAQQEHNRANRAHNSAINAIEQAGKLQIELDEANRELKELKNKAQAPVDAMVNMIEAQKELHNKFSNEVAKNKKLESELEFYKNLLSKPMKEIASKNENFKETYEAQQLFLAEWIVSEMAFAETAYEVGIDAGKSKEEINNIFKRNKIAVLLNKTSHENNGASNKVLSDNEAKLTEKIIKNAQLNRIR